MKFDNKIFFKIISVVLVCASLFYGAAAGIDAKKQTGSGVFYISPILNEPARAFDMEDIQAIEAYKIPMTVSYESITESEVSSGKFKAYAKTTKTNSDYFQLNHLIFSDGGPWIEKMQREKVAVVNESLAWQLFGQLSAAGGEIAVGTDRYKILGVVKDGEITTGNAALWLPFDEKESETGITSLFIKPVRYNPLGSYKEIVNLLNDLGKSDRLYCVTDLSRYADGIDVRYKILFFFAGIYGMLLAIKNLYSFIKKNPPQPRAARLLPLALMAAFNIAIFLTLWHFMQFDLWIPKFSVSMADQILSAVFNHQLLPPDPYLSANVLNLSQLNATATAAFILGCFGLYSFIGCGGFGKGGERQ